MKKLIIILLFLFTVILTAEVSHAATRTCGTNGTNNSCTPSGLQTLVNAASDGDTINIASGTHSWNSMVTVNNKALKIEGAGVGVTIISCSSSKFITYSGASTGGNVATLGNMTIGGSNDGSNGYISLSSSYAWRFHHIKRTGQTTNVFFIMITDSGAGGVVDDCQFLNSGEAGVAVMFIKGQASWWGNSSMNFGASNLVYVEGNVFSTTACQSGLPWIDGDTGARYVARFNTVTNMQGGCHGFDSSASAALQWELYNNQFNFDVETSPYCPISQQLLFRGGTGYIYNNNVYLWEPYGDYSPSWVNLINYRDTMVYQGCECDGTCSDDENLSGQTGYICFEQPGSGAPSVEGKTYTSVPVYGYNNTGTGNMAGHVNTWNSSTHVQSGRDYFSTTQKPGYTAYTCPHPIAGTGTCNSSAAGVTGYSLQGVSPTPTAPNPPAGLVITTP